MQFYTNLISNLCVGEEHTIYNVLKHDFISLTYSFLYIMF